VAHAYKRRLAQAELLARRTSAAMEARVALRESSSYLPFTIAAEFTLNPLLEIESIEAILILVSCHVQVGKSITLISVLLVATPTRALLQ
jgi:hypothetical protein